MKYCTAEAQSHEQHCVEFMLCILSHVSWDNFDEYVLPMQYSTHLLSTCINSLMDYGHMFLLGTFSCCVFLLATLHTPTLDAWLKKKKKRKKIEKKSRHLSVVSADINQICSVSGMQVT